MRKLLSSPLAALSLPEMAAGGLALALRGWWEEVNGSPAWQDGAFFSLSAAYALVSAVALVRYWTSSQPAMALSRRRIALVLPAILIWLGVVDWWWFDLSIWNFAV
jgi:hypothetical protein